MPISNSSLRAGAAGFILMTLAAAMPAAAQSTRQQPTFKSPEAAYEQGMGAWRSGFVEHAIPALKFAADRDVFFAQFYLARLYSDSGTAYTNHPAAYALYNKIAVEHANVDPDDDQRAPFVARALTGLAGYVRTGLPEIQLAPDPVRAVEYLRHASQFFNDQEAQFELAKHHLRGEGTPQDTRAGLHWLSVLTQRGHAGAQAYLADIYWRGRYGVQRDQLRAFALITVAVEHAPDSDRIWIEDIHQHIFCGSSSGTRNQAQGMVADWRQKYGRAHQHSYRSGLGALPPTAERTCRNGEAVAPLPSRTLAPPDTMQPGTPRGMLDVGVTRTEPSR